MDDLDDGPNKLCIGYDFNSARAAVRSFIAMHGEEYLLRKANDLIEAALTEAFACENGTVVSNAN